MPSARSPQGRSSAHPRLDSSGEADARRWASPKSKASSARSVASSTARPDHPHDPLQQTSLPRPNDHAIR